MDLSFTEYTTDKVYEGVVMPEFVLNSVDDIQETIRLKNFFC